MFPIYLFGFDKTGKNKKQQQQQTVSKALGENAKLFKIKSLIPVSNLSP